MELGSCSLLNLSSYKKPENNIVQIKGVLNDPGGGHSGSENVLLCRQIVRVADTRQVRQETETFKLMFVSIRIFFSNLTESSIFSIIFLDLTTV